MWREIRTHQTEAFSQEQRSRMNLDLMVMSGLTELNYDGEIAILVDKGYAIDALSHQSISRLHYDSDILIVTPPGISIPETKLQLKEQLDRLTPFQWEAVEQERESWIKYYQEGLRKWDDPIDRGKSPAPLAQQIDVHIISGQNPLAETIELQGSSGSFPLTTTVASIVDFDGNKHTVRTPAPEELLATKIRLIDSFRRHYNSTLRESDIYDFINVFNIPQLDITKMIQILSRYYVGTSGGNSLDVKAHIYNEILALEQYFPLPEKVKTAMSQIDVF